MKLKQYIELNKLDKNDSNYNLKVLDFFNIDYSNMKIMDVYKKVKELTDIKPNEIKSNKIKINGKWFIIDKEITKSKYNQFVTLESYMNDEKFFIEHLNEVLSIYVRPRVWSWKKLRWIGEEFDFKKKKKNDESLLDMDINDAFGLNVFFYLNETSSIKKMKTHYLNAMMKNDPVMI